MNRRRFMTVLANQAPLLPFTDTFTRDDGVLGNGWVGNLALASGAAVATPLLGDELFTGGDLEGTYTAGLCAFYVIGKSGTPTISESADVHGGSKAQAFQGAASDTYLYGSKLITAGLFHRMSVYVKRLSGTAGKVLHRVAVNNENPINGAAISSAAYTEDRINFFANINSIRYYLRQHSGTSYDSVVVDDYSLKPITLSSITALQDFGTSNFVARAFVTTPPGSQTGLILCGNTTTPSDYMLIVCDGTPYGDTSSWIGSFTNVGGVVTKQQVSYWGNQYAAGKTIECVKVGDQAFMFYNYRAAGASGNSALAPITVPAGLVTNTCHGMVVSDESANITEFDIDSAPDAVKKVMAIGDSKTNSYLDTNSGGWVWRMRSNPRLDPIFVEAPYRYGIDGQTVATAKNGIAAYLAGDGNKTTPDYILINLGVNDVASLPDETTWKTNYRFILDACHTKYASAPIYLFSVWQQGQDANSDTLDGWIADLIAEHTDYLFAFVDERITLKGADNGATMMSDSKHPNATGYQALADAARALLVV